MTAKCTVAPRLAGAAIGVAVLVAMVPVPGAAQPDAINRTTAAQAAGPDGADALPRPKVSVPALQSARPQRARVPETQGRPWSLEDALPKESKAIERHTADAPAGSSPGLGRVPLKSGQGTFGFETETKFKPSEFADPQTVPALQPRTHREPSYLGLSLSVPTTDKSIIPVPPWVRPE